MSKATAKPSSSFLKKKKPKSGLFVGEIKVKSCVGNKLRKSSTSAKSGTFSPEFKNRHVFAAVAPEIAAPIQAAAPTPAPTPAKTNTGILFDLSSFNRSFDVDGNGLVWQNPPGFIGPPPPRLSEYSDGLYREGTYYKALLRAATRWAHFLSFTPEMVAVIRQTKPNWNGIELNKFLISKNYPDPLGSGTIIASCETEILTTNTSLNSGFYLMLNDTFTKTYTTYQLFHLFTHELGHALGMPCPTVTDGSKELLPKIITSRERHFYNQKEFPTAYNAYGKTYGGVFRRNTEKLLASLSLNWIPVDNQFGHHWSPDAFIYDLALNDPEPEKIDPRYVVFRGILNDVMVPTFSDYRLISEISLGELCDIYTKINGADIYNYQRNTENSEVTGHSLTHTKDKIYFSGTIIDPLNKGIKIEGEEEEEKTWFKETIIHNCSECKSIYLDACGDCV